MADDDMVKLSAPEARATPRPDDMVRLGGPAPDYSGGAPTPAPTPAPEPLAIRAIDPVARAAGQTIGEAVGIPAGAVVGAGAGTLSAPLTGPMGPIAGAAGGGVAGGIIGGGVGNTIAAHQVNRLRGALGYPPIPVENFTHLMLEGSIPSAISRGLAWMEGKAARLLTDPLTYGTASPAQIEEVGEQGAAQQFKQQAEQSAESGFQGSIGKTRADFDAQAQELARPLGPNDPGSPASSNMLDNSRTSVLNMANRRLQTIGTARSQVIASIAGNPVTNLDTLSDRVTTLSNNLHNSGIDPTRNVELEYARGLTAGTQGPVTIRKIEAKAMKLDEMLRRRDLPASDEHVINQLADAYHDTLADNIGANAPHVATRYRELSKQYRQLNQMFNPIWNDIKSSKVAEDVPNRLMGMDRASLNSMLSQATPQEIGHLQDSLASDIMREKEPKAAAALFTKLEQKHPEAMRRLLPGFDNAKAWADILDAGKNFQKAFEGKNVPTLQAAFDSGVGLAAQTPETQQFHAEMQRLMSLPEVERARRMARLEMSAHPPSLTHATHILEGKIKVGEDLPFGRFGLSTYGRRYIAFQGVLGAMALGAGGVQYGLFNKAPWVAAAAVPLLFGPMAAGAIARNIISNPERGAEMYQWYKKFINLTQGTVNSRSMRLAGYYAQRLGIALATETLKEDGITAPATPAAAPNPAAAATPAPPGTP